MRNLKRIVLWIGWVLLAVIYVATVWSQCVAGKWHFLLFAMLDATCCALLAVAEALEVAFIALFAVQESADPDIRESFRGLDAPTFLSERQAIVALTIVTLTATTMFEWIYIPFLGPVSSHGAPAWFALMFVTSSVLWACQIAPKVLAAKAPCRFWKLTRWLVRPVLMVGRATDLRAPATDLVRLWERIFSSPEREPEHRATSTQVAQLWACSCDICSPRSGFAETSSSRSLCDCQVCNPVTAQGA